MRRRLEAWHVGRRGRRPHLGRYAAPGRGRSRYASIGGIGIRGAVAVVAVAIVATGCGPGRSVQAFCSTFREESIRLHDKYHAQLAGVDPKKDPFGALLLATGTLVEAQGDMVVLLDRLDRVAPEQIEPDVAALRDGLKKQAETMRDVIGNPLGALGSMFIGAIQSTGSYNRTDDYIRANCDLSFQT